MRWFATIAVIASVCNSCTDHTPAAEAERSAPSLDDISKTNSSELLCLIMPPLHIDGLKLTEAIERLNENIKARVGGDPRGEVIISRHDHPSVDHGDRIIHLEMGKSQLIEQLSMLAKVSMSHWKISSNGYLIFRTWHKPQFHDAPLEGTGLEEVLGKEE